MPFQYCIGEILGQKKPVVFNGLQIPASALPSMIFLQKQRFHCQAKTPVDSLNLPFCLIISPSLLLNPS